MDKVISNEILELGVTEGVDFIHIDFELKSPLTCSLYRYIRDTLLEELAIVCGVCGIQEMTVSIPLEDEKSIRFANSLDFEMYLIKDGVMHLKQEVLS